MKRLKYLVIILTVLFILPFSVFAEESTNSTTDTDSKKVNLYFFRGEGCPHCEDAEKWFDSIQGEYGSYFKVVDYEVWNNEDNNELMQKVAKMRNEKAEGVPYIIIGNKSWSGFDTSYEDEMIEQIKKVYAQDVKDRYDIMNYVSSSKSTKKKKSTAGDVASIITIVVVVAGCGYGIYRARKSTNE